MAFHPFDFSHYYPYSELVDFLDRMTTAYPNLSQLQAIGQSYGGKEIWLATVTNQKTGNPLEKPGYWIDANTHAGEVTGSAVACYILYYLLTEYDQDPQVTYLLDNYTVYILPRIAVDGAEKYLTTPHRLRSSIRPYPYNDEQEGLYREDVNGDGLILEMRIKDDCGAWKISDKDPRIMIRRQPEEFGGTYYTILPEGLIRNYDGYEIKLAPTLEGLDFNRNYPS
jgi:murein tripeptide amidase MpaA